MQTRQTTSRDYSVAEVADGFIRRAEAAIKAAEQYRIRSLRSKRIGKKIRIGT